MSVSLVCGSGADRRQSTQGRHSMPCETREFCTAQAVELQQLSHDALVAIKGTMGSVPAAMRNARRRSPKFECLELALGRGRFQLRTEWFSYRRKDNGHVPGRRSGFISPNMPHP